MFELNEFIVHKNAGVCQVKNVGTLDMLGIPKEKVYYTLCPYYTKESRIFIPVEKEKDLLRPILTKQEAMELIDGIKDVGFLWITDEKKREVEYKKVLQKSDCIELVKIIKTIYQRKQTRLASGKKVTVGDEKYFRIAEDNLYGELAISLDMDREEVKDYFIKQLSVDVYYV